MARVKSERFIVTGPGFLDGEEPSYADPGPALSRALTAALQKGKEDPDVTYYARDAVTGEIVGHAEKIGGGYQIHRR